MKSLHKKIIPGVLVGAIVLGGVLQYGQVVSFANEAHSPTRFKN